MEQNKKRQIIVWMMLSAALGVSMVLGRMVVTGTITYVFLIKNLILAWIPMIPALAINRMDLRQHSRKLMMLVLFGIWLVFFPNAPYIITDIIHLKTKHGAPFWYDLVMMFTLAWNGLLIGYVSLMEIEQFIERHKGPIVARMAAMAFLIAGGIGVYVGRYWRWNSWDVVARPEMIISDLMQVFLDPLSQKGLLGFTIFFSAFLILSYVFLKVMIAERKMLEVNEA